MNNNGDLPAMPVRGNCVDASGAYFGDVVYSAGLTKREEFADTLTELVQQVENFYTDSNEPLINLEKAIAALKACRGEK